MNLLNEIYNSSTIPKDLDFEVIKTNYVPVSFFISNTCINNIIKNREEKDLKMELKNSDSIDDKTQNITVYVFSNKINTTIQIDFLKTRLCFILFIYIDNMRVLDNIYIGNTDIKLLVFHEFSKLLGYKIEKIKGRYRIPFLFSERKNHMMLGIQIELYNIVLDHKNIELLTIDDTLTIIDEINYGVPLNSIVKIDKTYFKEFVKLLSEILKNTHKFSSKYVEFYSLYQKLRLNTNNIILLTKNKISYNYFVFRRKLDNFYVYTLNEISSYNFSLLCVE